MTTGPGDDSPVDQMDERRRSYWELFDFGSAGPGLEIGPLHRPMVRRGEARVSYLDVLDRDRLVEHYAEDPVVVAGDIPEVDFFLIQPDGRTLSLVEAVQDAAPFEWVMASHVIEHVPDLIGWLAQLAEIVVDGGALVLAVPDRRYCFDVHRPPTTVGQMIAAHEAGVQRPTPGSVYDYFAASVRVDAHELWRGDNPGLDRRIHTLQEARHHVERCLSGEYVDCHVWLFTPASFTRQLHELRINGLSDWMIETIIATPRDDLEFRVVLRRLPRNADNTGEHTGEVLPEGDLPDWLAESLDRPAVRRLERRIARLEKRLRKRGARVRRLRQRVREKDVRIAALESTSRRRSLSSTVRAYGGRLRRRAGRGQG
jgi:hypothetical protein